jgi:hypothetical protein
MIGLICLFFETVHTLPDEVSLFVLSLDDVIQSVVFIFQGLFRSLLLDKSCLKLIVGQCESIDLLVFLM